VGEAVSHLMPFGSPRALKRLVRTALARRIPVQGGVGTGGRAVAFVGAGGAGKTLCAARLAGAYAAGSDLPVLCLTLDGQGRDALARLLEPAGVEVLAPADAAEARAWMTTAGRDAQVVIDTPSVSPRDEASVRELASRVRGLGSAEVHLALPATTSAAAARDLIAGLAPLGARFVALTHADETRHLGSPVQVAIENERPVSYVSRGSDAPGGLEPADPAALATLVLP
jgi:flagellar biosynthesis protein FlhF